MEMWHLAHVLSPTYCSLAGSPFVGHQPGFFSRTPVGSETPVVALVCGLLLAQVKAQIVKARAILGTFVVQPNRLWCRDTAMMLARYYAVVPDRSIIFSLGVLAVDVRFLLSLFPQLYSFNWVADIARCPFTFCELSAGNYNSLYNRRR
jgi:hypothetical protein